MFRIVCVQERTITISVTGRRRSQAETQHGVKKLQKCDARLAWQVAAWPVMSSWCAGVTGAGACQCHCHDVTQDVTLGPHCQHWHPPLTDISDGATAGLARPGAAGARVRPGQVLCSLSQWRLARAEDRPQPGSRAQACHSQPASPATSQPGTKQGQQRRAVMTVEPDRSQEKEQSAPWI